MKKYTKDDFTYINFDSIEELGDFMRNSQLILYCDKDKNLYCFNYYRNRSIRFDDKQYKWVIDGKKTIKDFEHFDCIEKDLEAEIFKSIPPYECLKEFEELEAKETLEHYENKRKTTPRKVMGWLEEVSNYEEANDEDELYTGALLNDIIEHQYFFIASWMPLYPVFDDGTYLSLSDRAMGFVIGVSRGEAHDFDYVDYAFGEDYFFADDSVFNKPENGLYKKS